MVDVPQLRLIYPVPMDHADYPTVLNGAEVKISLIFGVFHVKYLTKSNLFVVLGAYKGRNQGQRQSQKRPGVFSHEFEINCSSRR
jgi:hypothetical protein